MVIRIDIPQPLMENDSHRSVKDIQLILRLKPTVAAARGQWVARRFARDESRQYE